MNNSGERWLLSLIWVGDTKESKQNEIQSTFFLAYGTSEQCTDKNCTVYVFKSTQQYIKFVNINNIKLLHAY